MTVKLDTVASSLSFNDLRHIRNIESRLLTALTVLDATLATLCEIQHAFTPVGETRDQLAVTTTFIEHQMAFRDLIRKCEAFIRSAKEVQKRNDKLIQLVCHALVLVRFGVTD